MGIRVVEKKTACLEDLELRVHVIEAKLNLVIYMAGAALGANVAIIALVIGKL